MPRSPSRQLVDAVKHGALENVHRLLAARVDPCAVKQVKCLLVTALRHPDPHLATEMTNALLAAGASWKGRSRVSPLDIIRQRRLLGVLPSLVKIPRLTRTPIRGRDGFFLAGLFAIDGWSEGLRALDALGVDIRHGVDDRRYHLSNAHNNRKYGCLRYWMSPSKKLDTNNNLRLGVVSTLRVWLAKVPWDKNDRGVDSDWVQTGIWLMEFAAPPFRRLEEQAALARELANLSFLDNGEDVAVKALEEAWMQSPHWWSEQAGRQAIVCHTSNAFMRPVREAARWRRYGWSKAQSIVERMDLSLDSQGDDFNFASALSIALIECQNMQHRPQLFKQSLARIAWVVKHGGHHLETVVSYRKHGPVWLEALQRPGVPLEALTPLREAGLDIRAPIKVSTYNPPKQRWSDNLLPLAHALKSRNLLALRQYLEEFPQEVRRRDRQRQTFLQCSTREAFFHGQDQAHTMMPLLKLFLAFGGDLLAVDNRGEHVLHAMIAKSRNPFKDTDAALALMWEQHPAMFDMPNADGTTPWEVFEKGRLQESAFAQSLLKKRFLTASWQSEGLVSSERARL